MSAFWERIEPGMVSELGSHTFTRQAILDFAKAYDPQRFHLDEDAAKASIFGALCASGWHTASVWMRLNILNGRAELQRLTGLETLPVFGPSPGIRDLRWLRPVYVGETVHYRTEIVEQAQERLAPRLGHPHQPLAGRAGGRHAGDLDGRRGARADGLERIRFTSVHRTPSSCLF